MVEVAVIGAGAAGIITARQLIQWGIRPHIFERRTAVGGAWQCPTNHQNQNHQNHPHHIRDPTITATSTTTRRTMLYPQMWDTLTPNLSKYTCCFSDMPWSNDTPMFPSLQQMNQYLNDYCINYNILMPPNTIITNETTNTTTSTSSSENEYCSIHYGCVVTRVSRHPSSTMKTDDTNNTNDKSQNSNLNDADSLPPPPYNNHRYEVQWYTIDQEEEEEEDHSASSSSKSPSTDQTTNDDGRTTTGSHRSTGTTVQSKIFDGVVIATGYFSQPVWPMTDPTLLLLSLPPHRTRYSETMPQQHPPTLYHSSQYQSSLALTYRNQTVAIIGNSFSAHEIASEISLAQMNSNETTSQQDGKVIHIIGRSNSVPYVVPRNLVQQEQPQHQQRVDPNSTLPLQHQGTMVVPIDSVIYRRQQDIDWSRGIPSEQVTMDVESCQRKHTAIQQYIGRRKIQQAAEKGYHMIPPDYSVPPHLSISDHYVDLVIDEKIQIIPGRMTNVVNNSDDKKYNIQLDNGTTVSDIDVIVCCTGYQCSMHDFIDSDLLHILQYDQNDTFAPMIACYDTFHPALPNFGMIGMYKGPYFGVMELQAKLYAAWLVQHMRHHDDDHHYDRTKLPETVLHDALLASEMRRHHQPRPQFPHFDYIGMMDHMTQLLRDLENTTNNTTTAATTSSSTPTNQFLKKGMMASPMFYQDSEILSDQMMNEYINQLRIHSDQNIAKSVLSALIGTWTFDRVITDTLTQSTQTITGTIRYTLLYDGSVRYREDGTMKLPNGVELEVFREYDYMSDDDGNLEIKFVENGVRTYRFLSLKFSNTVSSATAKESDNTNHWLTATSDHLCVKDLYTGTFQIQLDGCSANAIRITYNVKGPKKDYVSVTNLQPIL